MHYYPLAPLLLLVTVGAETPAHPYAVLDSPILEALDPSLGLLTPNLCANVFGKTCDGCTNLLTCLGAAEPTLVEDCAKTDKPYCSNGACSIHPPSATCTAAQPEHICSSAGYFPHPGNCHRYVLCADPGGASQTYDCPSGYVYNAATEQCAFQWWPTDCRQIVCPADGIDRYVAYPGNSGLYALCVNGDAVMFRCGDPANFAFSETSGRCALTCRRAGRVADPGDCRGYYECSGVWPPFQSAHWTCVQGYGYSATAQKCVRGVCETETPTVPPEQL